MVLDSHKCVKSEKRKSSALSPAPSAQVSLLKRSLRDIQGGPVPSDFAVFVCAEEERRLIKAPSKKVKDVTSYSLSCKYNVHVLIYVKGIITPCKCALYCIVAL
ncbi:hypothetical protein ILYODFUR_017095 [Ilyodon furcidens]|uniref:Uncharacterized protein n=1 Tax=Ilyodon furcidens TaxID=33524 RepID=A0ABV0TJB9_9TELE